MSSNMLVSLAVGASLIAATQAILLPPGVALESLDLDGIVEVGLIDPFTQITQVPCVGCPYAQPKGNGMIWVEGVENSLFLNISVGVQPDTLELNGFRFYPPMLGIMTTPASPSIAQVPADVPLTAVRQNPAKYLSRPLRVSGWSFKADSAHTASDSGDEVLSMKMHISSLEGQPVIVPDIAVTVLKGPDAKLMILNVKFDDITSIPSTPEGQQAEECKNWPLLCKWKAILASKLQGMKTSFEGLGKLKGCHKRPGGATLHRPATNLHHGPNSHHDGAGMHHHHKNPHHNMHHGEHKHHGVFKFLRTAGRVIIAIIIPVLAGITIGLTTYILGMLIGCGAAFIWNKLRGSRRGQYAAVPADEEQGSKDTEKEVFVVESEEEFDAPPVYEEAAEKEVVQHQE